MQDLKSLLENIYYILAESAPPLVPSEGEEEVIDNTPPATRPKYVLRDTNYPLNGPGLSWGPWDWGWLSPDGEIRELWPPSMYPTTTTPPYGPGGFWVYNSSNGERYYVYRPSHAYDEKTGTHGLFSAWQWNEKLMQFVEQVPAWGNDGGSFGGGGGH